MTFQPRSFALALLAIVSSCSEAPSSAGGPVPIERFVDEYGAASCRAALACSARVRMFIRDEASCVASLFETVARMPTTTLVQRVRSGALRYDPIAARRCIEQLTSGCYHNFSDLGTPAACRDAFRGAVAIGGPCVISAECAGDAWCSTRDDRGSVCPGECTPRVALGATCRSSAQCPVTTSAGGAISCTHEGSDLSVEPRCRAITLDPPAAAGARCGRLHAADGEHATPCALGLWCDGVCKAPIAAGAACDSEFDECVDDHQCAGPLSGPKRCVPVVIRVAVGETCRFEVSDPSPPLSLCDASTSLFCEGGRCARIPEYHAGSSCDPTVVYGCSASLRCDRNTRTCLPLLPEGATCRSRVDCLSGACDETTSVCAAALCE